MFQDSHKQKVINCPIYGIDTTAGDNVVDAVKYMENILINKSSSCSIRYGTEKVSELPKNWQRIFTRQIYIMSFINEHGLSEKLVYQNYLEKSKELNNILNSITDISKSKIYSNKTHFKIDISKSNNKTKIIDKVIDNCYLYFDIKSDKIYSNGAYIDSVKIENDILEFELELNYSYFENKKEVIIWWEYGSIYNLDNNLTISDNKPIIEKLDPNVIVSSVNYNNKLLITNGIDPVYIYHGNNKIEELLSFKKIPNSEHSKLENSGMYFLIGDCVVDGLIDEYKNIKTVYINKTIEKKVVEIKIAENKKDLFINFEDFEDFKDNITSIFYKVKIPKFSSLWVAKKRLWAIGAGRDYLNKYRGNNNSMRVFYSHTQKTYDEWYNFQSGDIDFINIATNVNYLDNVERVVTYKTRTVFMCRNGLHIYKGYNPVAVITELVKDKDGIKIEDSNIKTDFILEKVINTTGLLQKSLVVELPNDILFVTQNGIVSLTSYEKDGNLKVADGFSKGVHSYVKSQLGYINNDIDYRSMRVFKYPYGQFVGFILKYNCLIYQTGERPAWSIFTGNFSKLDSVHYDNITQNLYLGLPRGITLKYSDKINNRIYTDHGLGDITWTLDYNQIYTGSTWMNEKIAIACNSLRHTKVGIKISVNNNETNWYKTDINIKHRASLYDSRTFRDLYYAQIENAIAHEMLNFQCDSFSLIVYGNVNNKFVINKFFLIGAEKDSGSN